MLRGCLQFVFGFGLLCVGSLPLYWTVSVTVAVCESAPVPVEAVTITV